LTDILFSLLPKTKAKLSVKGENNLTREGLIPTVLGTAVTAAGLALRNTNPLVGWGITGFGLAHIVLGTIDLIEHREF
jgi:hypothetical protein